MSVIYLIFFGVLGLAVGSFLNLCIDRLPRRQSIIRPASRCDSCDRALKLLDLIPVFSYLWMRGKCRYCGSPVPVRNLIVELATGVIFLFCAWYFGFGLQLAIAIVYMSIFIVIFAVDLEHLIIPNRVVYPAMLLALVFSGFWAGFDGFWPNVGLVNALLGGAVGLLLMLLPLLIFPQGLGMGDVKLAALMGLICGFPLVLIALMLGILYGGLVAIFLLLFRVKGRKDAIPFGPFLAGGAVLTLLWGTGILQMYETAMTNLASLL
jgi:leader peptidase (prepilin peptidase)/N-methyltransferase